MSQSNEFIVISSNETKKGNFCNKIQNKSVIGVDTEFGRVESERQTTYYLFTKETNEVGKKAKLDLAQFDLVEQSYEVTEGDAKGEVIQLKYLYPKRA